MQSVIPHRSDGVHCTTCYSLSQFKMCLIRQISELVAYLNSLWARLTNTKKYLRYIKH